MMMHTRVMVIQGCTLACMILVTSLGGIWLDQKATGSAIALDWLRIWAIAAMGWTVLCGIAFVRINRYLQSALKFNKLLEQIPALKKAMTKDEQDNKA